MAFIRKICAWIGARRHRGSGREPRTRGCKRMGFTVNDYGKEGPTNDSKELLDKHITKWAAEQGIEKYTVGKKDVNCELFLNLLVVDEQHLHRLRHRLLGQRQGPRLRAGSERHHRQAEEEAEGRSSQGRCIVG